MNLKELRMAAKEAGIKNYTRKKEATLTKELREFNKAEVIQKDLNDFKPANFSYDPKDEINEFSQIYIEDLNQTHKHFKFSLSQDISKLSRKDQFDRARFFRELNAPKVKEAEKVIPYHMTEEYRVAMSKKGKK